MFQKELKTETPEHCKNIIRHAILSSILSNKKKFSREYGEMVIMVDSRTYWRKAVFSQYKACRKVARDASDIDWTFIFDMIKEIREDLITHFPYKVIQVDDAEADDLIAVLCKWTQENDLDTSGLEELSKKTLIISSDGDFKQLHSYNNVRQYAPAMKKYVEKPKNVQHYINEHIAKGDRGDGVPGVLGVDNSFVDKIRQPALKKDRLEEFIHKGINACRNDEEIRNYQRNELLISFEKIPNELSNKIIQTFESCKINGSQGKIFSYLVKNDCRLLLGSIEDF